MHKPPLKWAGGKRWLVSHLKSIWEANTKRRYVEPFCGGLAVVLGLQPKQALLNDVNPHLINFYRHVQNGLSMRVRMRNDEVLFYRQQYILRFQYDPSLVGCWLGEINLNPDSQPSSKLCGIQAAICTLSIV